MKFFECCRYCPDTKRHAGCHSECPEYIEQRKLLDEHNLMLRQKQFEESLRPFPKRSKETKYKY